MNKAKVEQSTQIRNQKSQSLKQQQLAAVQHQIQEVTAQLRRAETEKEGIEAQLASAVKQNQQTLLNKQFQKEKQEGEQTPQQLRDQIEETKKKTDSLIQ